MSHQALRVVVIFVNSWSPNSWVIRISYIKFPSGCLSLCNPIESFTYLIHLRTLSYVHIEGSEKKFLARKGQRGKISEEISARKGQRGKVSEEISARKYQRGKVSEERLARKYQ